MPKTGNFEKYVGSGSDKNLNEIFNSEQNIRKIKQFFIHPGYKYQRDWNNSKIVLPINYDKDLALIELERPFELNKNGLLPGCLLDIVDFNDDDDLENDFYISASYGIRNAILSKKISEPFSANAMNFSNFDLESTKPSIINQREINCSYLNSMKSYIYDGQITDDAICTFNPFETVCSFQMFPNDWP